MNALKRWMLLGFVAGWGLSLATAAEWIKLESDEFVIMSDGSKSAVKDFAKEYAGFREAARQLFARPGVVAPKSIIILHSRHSDFVKYGAVPAQDSRTKPFSFSTEVDGRATTAMARGSNWNETRRMANEFETVWLLRRYGWSLPTWMGQGSGIVLSTAFLDGDQKVVVGMASHHAGTWLDDQMLPWERFFDVGRTSPEYRGEKAPGIYHAQAWGLMHWLLLRDDQGTERFTDLASRMSSESWDEAVVEVGGVALDDLDREIRKHIRGRIPKRGFPFDADALEKAFVIEPLDEAELLAIQSDIAAAAGNTTEADLRYFQAVSLAPNAASTLEAGARWMLRRGERAGAIDKYRAAIDAGSQNANAYLASADFRLDQSGGGIDRMGGGIAIVLEPAEAEVRRALELDAGFGEAYQLLGRIAYLEPEPDAEKLAILSRRIGPDFWGVQAQYYRALLLDRLGREAEATADFQWIVNQSEVSPNTKNNAQTRLSDQRLRSLREALEPILKSGEFEHALQAIDTWEATEAQDGDEGTLRSLRGQIADQKRDSEQRSLDREMRILNQKIKAKQFADAQKAARELKQREVSQTLRLAFERLAEQVDEIATMQLMRAANRAENWAEAVRLANEYLPTAPADAKYREQIEAALAEAQSHL